MLTALLLAAAIAVGAHPLVVVVAMLAVVEPRLLIVGLIAWAIYALVGKRRTASDAESEAAFLRSLASELRGGASLRAAIADVAARSSLGLERAGRMARAGMPIDRVGGALRRSLAHNGVAAAAAVELSAWSGARAAAVFEGLADRASDAAEVEREQRTMTTQARMSAWVVGLAPLVFTTLILAAGGADSLGRAGAAGYVIMAVGLTLEVLGVVVVAIILRRASR